MGEVNRSLQVLHYGAPILTFIYYLSARTVATCFLHKPPKSAVKATRRYASILLLVFVCASIIAQAISFFAQSAIERGTYAPQDDVVYILASVFVFGTFSLGLAEKKEVVWHPYLGSCLVAVALEIPITVLTALRGFGNDFVFARLALSISRTLALVVFCAYNGYCALSDRRHDRAHPDEVAPLLANGSTQATPKYGTSEGSDSGYDDGDSSDDEDEPDKQKELKEQQRKRLAEKGSWLGYVKEFRIFIPMIWPSKDRFVQMCLGIIGLVLIAERALNVLIPRQLGLITDQLAEGHGNGEFPMRAVVTWMILSWMDSGAGITIIQNLAEIPVEQFTYKSLGTASFTHIMNLSMDFHNEKNSGELIRAVSQGQNLTQLLEFVLFQVAPIFADLIIAFVYVSILFDIYMTCILVFAGIAFIWVGAKTTAWSVKRRRKYNTASRNESKIQVEAVSNWQTVSHFNRSAYERGRYSGAIDDYNTAERRYYFAYFLGGGIQSLIMVLGRLAATFLAIYRVSQGTVPLGNLITLTAYWRNIESPLARVSWSIRRVTAMLTDSERLLQLFLTQPTVKDSPDATELVVKSGEVVFADVEFAYDVRKTTIKGVSFTAKPGQTVALVGETGGGKSTILKLLYRYYDPTQGSIRIDGQDLRDVTLDSLRDSFGMVPQDPTLFNLPLMENIRYARLDATDEEVKDACRAAAIHDKIETFPDKYKATVGERGVKLSGGELQRVAIARAILRNPKIVLLDEATSQVDAETEAVIHQGLRRLTAGRTTFIIAHRLSTIQHADLILVINDGKIIESGTHDELFQKKGKYVALWSKQLSKDTQAVGKALDVKESDPAVIDLDSNAESDSTK